jgi:outer membrane lipoprotein SlyB
MMQGFRRKTVSVLLILSMALFVGSCEPYHQRGAAVGGAVGGLAGALLDDKNPWRGGLIGAALGAAFGATLAEVSAQGAREAAETGQPVEYRTRTDDGRAAVYRADPVGYDARTKCHKVQERVWQDGQLVKDEIKEVCESRKTEYGYLGEQREGPYEREYEREYEGRYEERYEDRDYYPPAERDYDEYAYRGKGGPPPWAPAHGYRAKHSYRYYPDSYVYYNPQRDLYYYRYAGRWVESELLPVNIYLDEGAYVVLEMDEDEPYRFHNDVVKQYPPGYKMKRKNKWR